MKLLAHNGSRVWGGNEKWLSLLARGLRERGHGVLVSCVAGAPLARRLEADGVATTPVRPRGDLDLVSAWRFRRLVARERPDVVLLTTWRRTARALRAARAAAVPRVAVRLGIVRPLPGRGRRATRLRQDVDLWIVNSEEIRRTLLESAPGLPPERVRLLLNGVHFARVPPAPLREALGLPADARLVAATGRVTGRKGYDLMVEALAGLPADTHLVAAGETGEVAERLDRRAEALGVRERLHWLGFQEDVPGVLAAADAFVLASRSEGMANAMLEAMAAGLPVVATDVSGVGEALAARDGRGWAGWIVRPEEVDSLTAALGAALAEGRDGPRAREARWRAEHWFGVERMVEEAETLLEAGGRR